MIALITSTLIPNTNSYSYFTNETRIEQTKKTLISLQKLNFESIFILDNSTIKTDLAMLTNEFIDVSKIKFYHNYQYSFKNKGLNEALLILNNLAKLPKNQSVFKISGRYYPTDSFKIIDFTDFSRVSFIGKGYDFEQRNGTISTRAYAIKDTQVLEEMLTLSIEDMLSYSSKIVGFKSLYAAVKNCYKKKIGCDFQISIEHSFARILKKKYKSKQIDSLNIEGFIAGENKIKLISE